MKTYRITGQDAIRIAERDLVSIKCKDNPICLAGSVTVGEAKQIIKDGPELIYIEVVPIGWRESGWLVPTMPGYNVSDYFNSTGMYLGPDDHGVEPKWDDAN